mgnify:CR=1
LLAYQLKDKQSAELPLMALRLNLSNYVSVAIKNIKNKKSIIEPKRRAPVSPRNTFLEGLKLKNKNPDIAPTIEGITRYISSEVTVIRAPIKIKNLTDNKADSPSIPSIRLNAFTTTIKTKTETTY